MTEQIVKLSGLPMNFVVCRISHAQNAFATMDKYGNRFIKYDEAFMKRLSRDSTSLESMIILTHEVGHHIFFHTVESGTDGLASNYMRYGIPGSPGYDPAKFKAQEEQYCEIRRRQELEADRFAGFVMAKKQVPLEKVTQFYRKLGVYYTGNSDSTHPSIDKRIKAVKEGFAQVAGAPGRSINLSKIGGENLDLVFNNTTKLDRDKLLKKVTTKAIDAAAYLYMNRQYKLGYGTSGTSIDVLDTARSNALKRFLGRDFAPYKTKLIDDDKEYLEIQQTSFYLLDAQRVYRAYYFAFHVRGGYFYLLMYEPDEEWHIAYKSRFEDQQISYEELKLLFTRTFKSETQKLIDGYAK